MNKPILPARLRLEVAKTYAACRLVDADTGEMVERVRSVSIGVHGGPPQRVTLKVEFYLEDGQLEVVERIEPDGRPWLSPSGMVYVDGEPIGKVQEWSPGGIARAVERYEAAKSAKAAQAS